MRDTVSILSACVFLAGWAASSNDIAAQHVSPLQYQTYSRQQIGAEAERVSRRVAQIAGVQDDKATSDAVAMSFMTSFTVSKGAAPPPRKIGMSGVL